MDHFGIAITGTGSYVPEQLLTNADLERMVETSDEWIQTRTGIQERHIAPAGQPTSDLGARAAERALADAGITAAELDAIIVATFTPDQAIPNTGCLIQRRLGAKNAFCFSIEAACSGFVYGLEVAGNLIRSGCYRNVLLVGAEKISSILDWTDRNTCVLFGDGAGAVVLQRATERRNCSLLSTTLGADGNYADLLQVPAGGSAQPLTAELLAQHMNCIKMEGREIFKLAVNAMVDASKSALAKAELTAEQVRWVIPHQANLRIISSVGKYLGVPDEKVFVNLQKYGNTSAASIPIALDELVRSGQVKKGEHLLLTAFGAGLTWGAAVVRWEKE